MFSDPSSSAAVDRCAPQAGNSLTFLPPPLDGSMTLPELFDYNGYHNPDHPLFVYQTQDGSNKVIPWHQVVRAIHTAARYVQSSIRPENIRDKSTVVTILANTNTFTYFIMVIGIMRAGYQAFPISPRNSPVAVAHLVRQAQSSYMFVSEDRATQRLSATMRAHPSNDGTTSLRVLPMPSSELLFEDLEGSFEPLPPMEHPDCGAPALILHSSGSTAFPKPVIVTHRALLQWGLLPYYGDMDICGQVLSAHSVPLYHATGALMLVWTMTTGLVLSGFSPHDTPIIPTPDRVFSSALATGSTIIFCVPSLIEAWAQNSTRIDDLKRFRAVIFAGAPMQKNVGDKLVAKGVNLIPFYGATEVGCVTKFIPYRPKDGWEYFEFSSHCVPAFVPYQDDIYRLLILDSPTLTPNILDTEYDGVRAYDTNDLVVPHPNIRGLWRIHGRCDDQITHSTGEKTNPLPIETVLVGHPMIRGAVMFGRGRFHPGILLDPAPEYAFDSHKRELLTAFKVKIWTLVEEANTFSPAHSRLFREMIIVSHPSKPFEYTEKGMPRRKVVLDVYAQEIEQTYDFVEEADFEGDVSIPLVWDQVRCIQFARECIENILKCSVTDDDDIFQLGCDSFQATWIRNLIVDGLRRSTRNSTCHIPQNFVYANPTVRRLATFLDQIVRYGQSSVALCNSSGKIAEMESLAKKYSRDFPPHRLRPFDTAHLPGSGDVVLLTGSTGFLGSHLLKELVESPEISKVYALNRRDLKSGRSVLQRQLAGFKDRGIDAAILESGKIELLEGAIALKNFGLEQEVYQLMLASVTHIIHNAWRVDFNISLSSLEPLLVGTRRLIDFSLASPLATPPRFIFVSSLSVFTNWARGSAVPEAITRPGMAMGAGYTESKWVAESILSNATETTPLHAIIVRVGHICGGSSGHWNTAEWVPTLVRAGQILRCLPRPDGIVTWLPVNAAATSIIEMRKSDDAFLNLTHPNPVSARFIFEAFAEMLGVRLVCYSDWLLALETSRSTTDRVDAHFVNPALLLLDFYRTLYRPLQVVHGDMEAFGFPTPSIDRALAAAPRSLGHISPLSLADVESWIRYWREIGFLSLPRP